MLYPQLVYGTDSLRCILRHSQRSIRRRYPIQSCISYASESLQNDDGQFLENIRASEPAKNEPFQKSTTSESNDATLPYCLKSLSKPGLGGRIPVSPPALFVHPTLHKILQPTNAGYADVSSCRNP